MTTRTLVDNQGREFSISDEGQAALVARNEYTKIPDKINPKDQRGFKIVFDIPQDAEGLVLKISKVVTGKVITFHGEPIE